MTFLYQIYRTKRTALALCHIKYYLCPRRHEHAAGPFATAHGETVYTHVIPEYEERIHAGSAMRVYRVRRTASRRPHGCALLLLHCALTSRMVRTDSRGVARSARTCKRPALKVRRPPPSSSNQKTISIPIVSDCL